MIARASGIETSPHAFLSHAQQFLLFFTDLADWEGPRVIANPSVNRGARVDRKDIPIAKNRFRGRNAVDNLIIDRGANRTRESAISLESRDTPFRADGLLRKLVKLKRRNLASHARPGFEAPSQKGAPPRASRRFRQETSRSQHLLSSIPSLSFGYKQYSLQKQKERGTNATLFYR